MTLRVIQLTDIHLTGAVGSELYGVDTALSLQKVIDAIKDLPKQADVVIITGDLAEDGSKTTYRRLRDLLKSLDIPVYVLPGNHDSNVEMISVLNSGQFHYTDRMHMQDWGFVFVNSQVAEYSHGFIRSEELDRLERNISAFNDVPVLVALHHTPSNVCPSFDCQLENASQFNAVLSKYPNVRAVIAGHTHIASEIHMDGYCQFNSPSTFAYATHAQLGEAVDHNDFWDCHSLDGTKQGFRTLDLLPDGEIISEVHFI